MSIDGVGFRVDVIKEEESVETRDAPVQSDWNETGTYPDVLV